MKLPVGKRLEPDVLTEIKPFTWCGRVVYFLGNWSASILVAV